MGAKSVTRTVADVMTKNVMTVERNDALTVPDGLMQEHGVRHLPVLDGFQAARAIRAAENESRVPIVALTANALSGDRERCLEAGMDDYLSKPFAENDLFALLSHWLADTERAAATELPVDVAVLDKFRTRERDAHTGAAIAPTRRSRLEIIFRFIS